MSPEHERAAQALRKASSILAITGAGISAESDIPTFRGEGGFWRSYDPEQLATWRAFKQDPATVWKWYDHRRRLIAGAQPNAAHKALAALEKAGKRVFIITQNVDDLHEGAGSQSVTHIHGLIWQVTCLKEKTTWEDRAVPLATIPLFCPSCGSLVRPNVVWFDEELPEDVCARIDAYFKVEKPEVALVIGTHATFDYIRDYAIRAKRMGALLVEVNPEHTVLTPLVDVAVHEPAGDVLARFVEPAGV
jgi:NAD-dependent protein deacetylase/lipoamidase